MIRVIDNFINKEQLKKIDEIIKNSKPEDGLATTSLNSTYYKKNTQYFSNKELWETILSKNVCYFIQENVSCSTFYPGQIMVSEYNKSDFYEDHVDNAFLGTRARKISFSINFILFNFINQIDLIYFLNNLLDFKYLFSFLLLPKI